MLKIAIILSVIVLFVAAYIRWVVPFARSGQISLEHEHVTRVATMVLRHRNEHGRLPNRLGDALSFDPECELFDLWGTELSYEWVQPAER